MQKSGTLFPNKDYINGKKRSKLTSGIFDGGFRSSIRGFLGGGGLSGSSTTVVMIAMR